MPIDLITPQPSPEQFLLQRKQCFEKVKSIVGSLYKTVNEVKQLRAELRCFASTAGRLGAELKELNETLHISSHFQMIMKEDSLSQIETEVTSIADVFCSGFYLDAQLLETYADVLLSDRNLSDEEKLYLEQEISNSKPKGLTSSQKHAKDSQLSILVSLSLVSNSIKTL